MSITKTLTQVIICSQQKNVKICIYCICLCLIYKSMYARCPLYYGWTMYNPRGMNNFRKQSIIFQIYRKIQFLKHDTLSLTYQLKIKHNEGTYLQRKQTNRQNNCTSNKHKRRALMLWTHRGENLCLENRTAIRISIRKRK